MNFFVRIRRIFFWLAWPFWFFYFKVNSNRTRLLVVANGKILIVRSWLDGEAWALPGGGAKRGEDLKDGAVRELLEETGIQVDPSQLEPIGSVKGGEFGLHYNAHYFVLRLDENVKPKRQLHEIADVAWYSQQELNTLHFNHDAQYGLDKYGAMLWYNDEQ